MTRSSRLKRLQACQNVALNSQPVYIFGHDGIKLEAKDNIEKTSVKFEVTRDGKSAYNLSEGECSLIAFCYFIAKLEEPTMMVRAS